MKLSDVQAKVFEVLNEGFEEEGYWVGDTISEDVPKPYIYLGAIESVPHRTKTTDGRCVTQSIQAYSNFDGKEEMFCITEKIEHLLSQEMEIEGVFVLKSEVAHVAIEETETGIIEGQMTFEILIQEVR